jgi:two-component system, sensor histidine kinase
LQAANLALEKAARSKDEFLATMSHELRTPLTGIMGLSQALEFQLKDTLNEKQMNIVRTIGKSGLRLQNLINDVLDYSRLQAGETDLQISAFSLAHTCRSGLLEIKRLAREKDLQFTITINPENIMVKSDERRVKQILINLLSNAIKFTPQGGRIDLSVTGIPDGAGFLEGQDWLPSTNQVGKEQALPVVCIRVRDNGIGIPAEAMERMFQPFTQLDASLSREYGGTGLGLTLVRSLTILLRGRVEVESSPGQGSTFSVYLPGE